MTLGPPGGTSPGVSPSFPATASTVAAAQFGWIHAAVSALVEDISGLPLVAMEVQNGKTVRVDDHPALHLLDQPASRTDGLTLSQQQIARWALTGNGLWRILSLHNAPTSLLPLYPELVTLKPWADGQVGSVLYMGATGEQSFQYDEVLHVRRWSWEGDARGLYGASPVQALHRALLTYQNFENLTLLATQLGRITGVFSARASTAQPALSKRQLERAREWYEVQMSEGDRDIFLPHDFQFHPTIPKARDLEGKENQERVIELICAIFGVPAVRLMRTDAKFSNAGHAMRVYWEGLTKRVASFERQYTRLARMFPHSSRIRIGHDFAGISYLKATRKEAQERVKGWVDLGMDPNHAAAYEGFADAPRMKTKPVSTSPQNENEPEQTEDGDRDPEASEESQPDRRLPAVVGGTASPAEVRAAWGWTVIEGGQHDPGTTGGGTHV